MYIFIVVIQLIMRKGCILTISLKPHLADFCRHEMRQDKEGNIILSRKTDIGKYIYSNIVTADTPVKGLPVSDPVNFLVPVTGANQYVMKYRFVHVSRWGEEKIQDYIEANLISVCGYYLKLGIGKITRKSRLLNPFCRGIILKIQR